MTSALVCLYDQHSKEQLIQCTCKESRFSHITLTCPSHSVNERNPVSFKIICFWTFQIRLALIFPLTLVCFWEQKGSIQGHGVLLFPFSLVTAQHKWQIQMGAINQACELSICSLLSCIIIRGASFLGKDNGMRWALENKFQAKFLISQLDYITVTGYFRASIGDPILHIK